MAWAALLANISVDVDKLFLYHDVDGVAHEVCQPRWFRRHRRRCLTTAVDDIAVTLVVRLPPRLGKRAACGAACRRCASPYNEGNLGRCMAGRLGTSWLRGIYLPQKAIVFLFIVRNGRGATRCHTRSWRH